jgi:hypothetical protein
MHAFRTGGDDSIMLEAIVALLAIATCALVLIAFWGVDLLSMQRAKYFVRRMVRRADAKQKPIAKPNT